jgi:hypothetical protein
MLQKKKFYYEVVSDPTIDPHLRCGAYGEGDGSNFEKIISPCSPNIFQFVIQHLDLNSYN